MKNLRLFFYLFWNDWRGKIKLSFEVKTVDARHAVELATAVRNYEKKRGKIPGSVFFLSKKGRDHAIVEVS